MTAPVQPHPDAVSEAREVLSCHEQMIAAQNGCVPCKLCGGKAVITDAGTGAGYYIRCQNSVSFRPSRGCLISEQRLGGWAYNVMDWWNRLHAAAAREQAQAETIAGLREEVRALRAAGQAVLDAAFRTYRARNGRQVSIEADDGEACEIVHSEAMEELRRTLTESPS